MPPPQVKCVSFSLINQRLIEPSDDIDDEIEKNTGKEKKPKHSRRIPLKVIPHSKKIFTRWLIHPGNILDQRLLHGSLLSFCGFLTPDSIHFYREPSFLPLCFKRNDSVDDLISYSAELPPSSSSAAIIDNCCFCWDSRGRRMGKEEREKNSVGAIKWGKTKKTSPFVRVVQVTTWQGYLLFRLEYNWEEQDTRKGTWPSGCFVGSMVFVVICQMSQ